MNRQKRLHKNIATNKITLVCTVVLLGMLILFLSITLYSTNQTASQVRIITEHPFVVHGDISDVKTN